MFSSACNRAVDTADPTATEPAAADGTAIGDGQVEANPPTRTASTATAGFSTAAPAAINPTATAAAAAINTPSPLAGGDHYLDDRSDPAALLNSLVNALNRHEYLRAYGYWEENAAGLPAFEQFDAGYAETESVQLQMGEIYAGIAAGNIYYDVPTILTAHTTQGKNQIFVGCYRLHLGSPVIQGALPFRPLAVQSAQIKQVATNDEAQSSLAEQCLNESGQHNGQPLSAPPDLPSEDISANRYLDDRSSGTQVIRSYFNAINRREYVRAYDYWQNQAALPALDDFIKGYEHTQTVSLLLGIETSDAGAGQFYSQIPVVLIAQTTNGGMETFAGCYTLHLSNPAFQATPPFQPWGVTAAEIHQVQNGADQQTLLEQNCS